MCMNANQPLAEKPIGRNNITSDKDRGQDEESAPWLNVIKDERINNHHLTRADKQAARVTGGRS